MTFPLRPSASALPIATVASVGLLARASASAANNAAASWSSCAWRYSAYRRSASTWGSLRRFKAGAVAAAEAGAAAEGRWLPCRLLLALGAVPPACARAPAASTRLLVGRAGLVRPWPSGCEKAGVGDAGGGLTSWRWLSAGTAGRGGLLRRAGMGAGMGADEGGLLSTRGVLAGSGSCRRSGLRRQGGMGAAEAAGATRGAEVDWEEAVGAAAPVVLAGLGAQRLGRWWRGAVTSADAAGAVEVDRVAVIGAVRMVKVGLAVLGAGRLGWPRGWRL